MRMLELEDRALTPAHEQRAALPVRLEISQQADLRSVVAHLVQHRSDRVVAALPGMVLMLTLEDPATRLVGFRW